MQKKDLEKRIKEIEEAMYKPDFWNNKDQAQAMIKELETLKNQKEGVGKYDKGNAKINIFAGAGGDDSEDFARMLFEMYQKFCNKKGWSLHILNSTPNEHNGYKNITFEVVGKNVYSNLKHESGVHRLVRQSPFNAKGQRHTSFVMVEVLPDFEKAKDFTVPEDELRIEFTKSSGPGGQNVNKRETAVRIVHEPTGISTFIDSERSQNQNKEKALAIIYGKLYNRQEEERKQKESGMFISKTTEAEWGSQIRSYVLHPYKLVKDHRSETESRDVDSILDGNIDMFIKAMEDLAKEF